MNVRRSLESARSIAVPLTASLALAAATLAGASGASAATGDAVAFPLPSGASGPSSIVSTASGDLWLTLSDRGALASISTAGAASLRPVTGLGTTTATSGIAQDQIGNLWFTETADNAVSTITSQGTDLHRVPLPRPSSGPTAIVAGPDGSMWFTESTGDRIGRVTTRSVLTEFDLRNGSEPTAIAAGPDGNLWFALTGGNAIGRITPTGSITTFPLPTADSAPRGITAGSDGNLWFTESGTNRIGRISPAGILAEFTLPTPGSGPWGIALGADGNAWFTESRAGRVGSITPSGRISEYALPAGAATPIAIASGADGNMWVAEKGSNRISRVLTGVTPVSSGAPTITGASTTVGSVLTAAPGAWQYQPASFGYQWQRCTTSSAASCADTPGATAPTRTVTAEDNGAWLRVTVRATNANGTSALAAASALTSMGPRPVPAPVVGGPSVTMAPGLTATFRAVNRTKRGVLRSYRVRFTAPSVRGKVRMTLVTTTGVEVLVIARGKWTTTTGPISEAKRWRRVPKRIAPGIYSVKAVYTPHPSLSTAYPVTTLVRTITLR